MTQVNRRSPNGEQQKSKVRDIDLDQLDKNSIPDGVVLIRTSPRVKNECAEAHHA
jgi:hypothetical protein